MYWLFLLIALALFIPSLSATHTGLMIAGLFLSLVFVLLWVKGLYAAKFGSVVNDVPRPLHAAELQALRDQLQARTKAAEANAEAAAPTPPVPAPHSPPQPQQDPTQP